VEKIVKLKQKEPVDIKDNIRDLIIDIPLLGFIIIKMDWIFDASTKTVSITKRCQLRINKEYFGTLTRKERMAVLKHESFHVSYRHFERLLGVSQPQIAITAKEIAINQYIDDLPKGCLVVEKYGLDKGLSLEEYYQKLLLIAKKAPDEFQANFYGNPLKGDIDELGEVSIPIGDKICQDVIAYAKSIGRETSHIEDKVEIVPTNYKCKINKLLGCQPSTTEMKKTNSRRSKRFSKSPGLKKVLQLGPAIMGLDTSGSMSNEMLAKSIDVAKKLRKKCSSVVLIQCNTEVKDIKKINKNIRSLNIKGKGGTELEPIIDKAMEFGYPKVPLIMFTDGELWSYPDVKKLKNSVWIFTQESTAREFHRNRPSIDYAVLT